MKRTLISTALAVFAGVCALAQGSKVINAEMPSKILGETKPYTIYLPVGYDENKSERYPVLYATATGPKEEQLRKLQTSPSKTALRYL